MITVLKMVWKQLSLKEVWCIKKPPKSPEGGLLVYENLKFL